jgi:hypothetical protein
VSRRDQITMSPAEVAGFLEEERTVVAATIGRDGWPHLMPLWYVVRAGADGPRVWAWTFAKSQKVRNLERDPRATLQVEAGREYHELRGVMLRTQATIHRDPDTVLGVGLDVGPALRRRPGAPARGRGGAAGAGRQARRAGVRRDRAVHVGPPQARRGY